MSLERDVGDRGERREGRFILLVSRRIREEHPWQQFGRGTEGPFRGHTTAPLTTGPLAPSRCVPRSIRGRHVQPAREGAAWKDPVDPRALVLLVGLLPRRVAGDLGAEPARRTHRDGARVAGHRSRRPPLPPPDLSETGFRHGSSSPGPRSDPCARIPTEVLLDRKQEISAFELERQAAAWRGVPFPSAIEGRLPGRVPRNRAGCQVVHTVHLIPAGIAVSSRTGERHAR
jgi:hypothetical protein